jgi:murein DD-endopeptidase MepM/ murein hydrolase activator NlpD
VLLAAEDGTVTDTKSSTSSATGRYLTIRLDDGRTVRYLHLAELWVGLGARVVRGQSVALSGASGHGSEWGYGAHVHVTLWPGLIWAAPTIDFDAHVDPPPPPPPEEEEAEMLITVSVPTPDGGQQYYSMNTSAHTIAPISNGTQLDFLRAIGIPEYVNQAPQVIEGYRLIAPAAATSSNPLVSPTWAIGVVLGLIGLVEVVRLVVDFFIT